MRSAALTILAILLALILGILLGRIIHLTEKTLAPTVLREDRRPQIPVVRITGAEDGKIIGSMHGEIRLFVGEQIVIPNGSGAFRVPASKVLRESVTVHVPVGMRFVASKRGKKFYPIGSASAARLAAENRVYFPDVESAQRAGFSSGQ